MSTKTSKKNKRKFRAGQLCTKCEKSKLTPCECTHCKKRNKNNLVCKKCHFTNF